ncbi:MAG: hypothetical protein V3T31_08400 [candidate division Zixibacteria bacterium]
MIRKRLLLICYYFPPLGLAGVGRPLGLFKKLPDYGYDCDILTVKNVAYRGYEPELLEGLDQSKIHRAGSYDPQRLMYLMGMRTVPQATISKGKPLSDRFFPDSKSGWVKPAVRLGRRMIKKHNYDALLSTSPPVSAHLVGMKLAAESGLPWIADFRDFWTMYKVEESFATEQFIKRGNSLLDDIRMKSANMTAVNQAVIDYIGSGDLIRNGYDSDRAKLWRKPSDLSSFNIGIIGNLNQERVIAPLLSLLSQLREQDVDIFERVRLIQVGQVDTVWLENLLASHGMSDRCSSHGFQPRDRTIELLSECSLFYLGLTADREQGILPQRMIDLSASGRPTLAYASQTSEVAKFIEKTGIGFSYNDSTLKQACDWLRDYANSLAVAKFVIEPRPDSATPYSSAVMAEKIAQILDRIT